MKTAGAALETEFGSNVTRLATCWMVVRKDGTVITGTTHQKDLALDLGDGRGVRVYSAKEGFMRSAVQTRDDMSVDNLEVSSYLIVTGVTSDDLRRGLYDRAEFFLFVVNYADLSQGILKMRRGFFGKVKWGDVEYTVEARGMSSYFENHIVEVYQTRCRAEFTDVRCKVVLHPLVWVPGSYVLGDVVRASAYDGRRYVATVGGNTNTGEPLFDTTIGNTTQDDGVTWRTDNSFVDEGTITTIPDSRTVGVSGLIDPIFDPNILGDGKVEWLTGQNAGLFMEVVAAVENTGDEHEFSLFLPPPFPVALGDTVRVYGGCDKTVARCKFYPEVQKLVASNIFNRRAESHVPRDDAVFQYETPT